MIVVRINPPPHGAVAVVAPNHGTTVLLMRSNIRTKFNLVTIGEPRVEQTCRKTNFPQETNKIGEKSYNDEQYFLRIELNGV